MAAVFLNLVLLQKDIGMQADSPSGIEKEIIIESKSRYNEYVTCLV